MAMTTGNGRHNPPLSPSDSGEGSLARRVLMIDDDEDDYVIFRDLLEDAKHDRYAVSWRPTPDAAYAALMSGEYEVCLLDFRLGEQNGVELLSRAISEGCTTPVVILTGHGDLAIETTSMEAGAADYLTKSTITAEGIERTLRHAIDRAAATRNIHRAEATQDATLASILDTIMRVSSDGTILEYLPGKKSDPATGPVGSDSTLRTVFGDETAAILETCLAEATLSASVCSCEFTTTGVMSVRFFEARFRPIDNETESIVILRDFTQEKVAQKERDELLQSQDRFLAGISHDLRTPLTSVLGYADLLATAWPRFSSDERSEMIDSIVAGASELAYLFEDVLVMARYETEGLVTAPREIDVAKHVAKALLSFAPDTPNTFTFEGDQVQAIADPMRLDQILRNMITNAVEHGGNEIAIDAGRTIDIAWIEVRDSGDGIPWANGSESAVLPHRSRGISNSALSAGLGLTVSHRLAHAMGGELTYDRVGGWTVFRLELPAIDTPTPERSRERSISEAPATARSSVPTTRMNQGTNS
jgi:two-component system, cell cycle sensor histidine kinase and response regulator CckA